MRVDRGRLNWGIFFIVLGAVPLAYQQRGVSSSASATPGGSGRSSSSASGSASSCRGRPPSSSAAPSSRSAWASSSAASSPSAPTSAAAATANNPSTSRSRAGSTALVGGAGPAVRLGHRSRRRRTRSGTWKLPPTAAATASGQLGPIPTAVGDLGVTQGLVVQPGKDDWQIGLPSGVSDRPDCVARHGRRPLQPGLSQPLATARFDLNLGSLHVDLTGAKVGTLERVHQPRFGLRDPRRIVRSDRRSRRPTSARWTSACPAGLGVQVTASDSLSSSDFSAPAWSKSGASGRRPATTTPRTKPTSPSRRVSGA
jgi:hypothetical protein